MNNKPAAIVYCRRSKNSDTTQANSLNYQLQSCQAFCTKHGYAVIEVIQESHTGRAAIRPGFEQAIQKAKETGAVVVVWSASRISRNLAVWERLNHLGLENLRIVTTGADMPVPFMVLAMQITMAAEESNRISARIKQSYQYLKSIDQHHSWGKGDRSTSIPKAKAACKETARVFNLGIQEKILIMKQHGATKLQQQIALLNAGGITTRRGSKWSVQSLHRVLKYNTEQAA